MAFVFQRLRISNVNVGRIFKVPTCAKEKIIHRSEPIRNCSSVKPEPVKKFKFGVRAKLGLHTAIAALGVGSGYYLWTTLGGSTDTKTEARQQKHCPKYQKVYDSIAKILEDSEYDDGSYGPIFVRLAWHASGTYCLLMNNGGSYKASMRFEPECKHNANKGLEVAREKLEAIKQEYPWVTYGDLWTLAGICAG